MAGQVVVNPFVEDGEVRGVDVIVPTERGTSAVINVELDRAAGVYSLRISKELTEQAPEAITAAIQMAFLALRDYLPATLKGYMPTPPRVR